MAQILVLDGAQRGTYFRLLFGSNLLGRGCGLDIRLNDEGVSRQHAELFRGEDGRFVLRDLGSKNATFLNGVRLEAEAQVEVGDEIRLGNTLLRLQTEPEPAADEETASLPPASPPGPRMRRVEGGFDSTVGWVLGDSSAMALVARRICRCAPLKTPVLIQGESGTGKELVARAVHRWSRRRGPLLCLNCATLDPQFLVAELFGHERGAFTGAVARRLGKLELAHGGTLFLDEIGELHPEAQAKLLRVLETQSFYRLGGSKEIHSNVRLVAATHRDLAAMTRGGGFREDLLFRLRVAVIELPPLRERGRDLRLLAKHFFHTLRQQIPSPAQDFSEESWKLLEAYAFPGNVRELKNMIERCLIFCEESNIPRRELPAEILGRSGNKTGEGVFPTLREAEAEHLVAALRHTQWNKAGAARLLAIDRATLYKKIRRYGLQP